MFDMNDAVLELDCGDEKPADKATEPPSISCGAGYGTERFPGALLELLEVFLLEEFFKTGGTESYSYTVPSQSTQFLLFLTHLSHGRESEHRFFICILKVVFQEHTEVNQHGITMFTIGSHQSQQMPRSVPNNPFKAKQQHQNIGKMYNKKKC